MSQISELSSKENLNAQHPNKFSGESVQTNAYVDREINLSQWWKILVNGRLTIALLASLALLVSLVAVSNMPNVYRAEALLVPAVAEENAGMRGIVGQIGGLANLAGVSIGSDGIDKTELSLEVLKSRVFIIGFVDRRELVVPLLAGKGWDDKSQKWLIDENKYDSKNGKWLVDFLPENSAQPSQLVVYDKFKSVLSVTQDKKSKLIYVGVELASPVAAKQWVDWLVEDLNVQIKQRDIENARKSIGYLQDQIAKTPVKEMQQIFYQLIEDQTKQMMLAELRDEYVLKTVDPAVMPEDKIRPKRLVICFFSALFGALAGVLIVSLRNFRQISG